MQSKLINTLSVFIFGFFFLLILAACSSANQPVEVSWSEFKKDNSKKVRFTLPKSELVTVVFNQDTISKSLDSDYPPFDIQSEVTNNLLNTRKYTVALKTDSLYYRYRLLPSSLRLIFKTWINDKPSIVDYLITPDCDTISKIVYAEFSNMMSQQIEKAFQKNEQAELDLNKLVDRLKKNQLKQWLAFLPDTPSGRPKSCLETYNLLKYLKEGDEKGFEIKEFQLSNALQNYLQNIAFNVKDYLNSYKNGIGEVQINVIGFADEQDFGSHKSTSNKYSAYYSSTNCSDFTKKDFSYVELDKEWSKGAFQKIPDVIVDNCQLSALRSYYAVHYLDSLLLKKLNGIDIRYFYAAGGVSYGEKYEENRKISIKILIRAGVKDPK